jgi:hypothetical protein
VIKEGGKKHHDRGLYMRKHVEIAKNGGRYHEGKGFRRKGFIHEERRRGL